MALPKLPCTWGEGGGFTPRKQTNQKSYQLLLLTDKQQKGFGIMLGVEKSGGMAQLPSPKREVHMKEFFFHINNLSEV